MKKRMESCTTAAFLGAALLSLFISSQAPAAAPLGACCLPNDQCVDTVEPTCLEQNGTFVGFNVRCGASTCTPAPVLSLEALAIVALGLGAIGAGRSVLRRRRP